MHVLESLAGTFFRVFGITQPKDKARQQAAWFLLGILVLVFAGLVGAGLLIYHLMRA